MEIEQVLTEKDRKLEEHKDCVLETRPLVESHHNRVWDAEEGLSQQIQDADLVTVGA